MNSVTESLLQAMDILVNNKVAKLAYDKTVRVTIHKVEDLDIGKYLVEYNGNVIPAYAADLTQIYAVSDEVYLKIPEADLSNKKIITGKVTNNKLSSSLIDKLSLMVFPFSPSFDEFYDYDKVGNYGICAGLGADTEKAHKYNDIYNPINRDNNGDAIFQQYSSKCKYLQIKADFTTQFILKHNKGQYWLEVVFYTNKLTDDDEGEVTFKLDFNSFNGDPYRFLNGAPQSVIFEVQSNYLMGLKSITLKQEGLEPDKDKNGDNITEDNIFVKNIDISFVDIQDLTKQPYYAYINAPSGTVFKGSSSTFALEAKLLNYGTLVDNCTYQWYERDFSIMIGSEDYEKLIGFGWKKIKDANDKTYEVSNRDVAWYLKEYRVLITYKDEVLMLADIEIINPNSLYRYHLEQVTLNDSILLKIINEKDDKKELVADWYISYPDNSYSELEANKAEINVTDKLVYSAATFYAAVHEKDANIIFGNLIHEIKKSDSQDDVTMSYIGLDMYRYDANGDIAITDSELDRTLEAKPIWKKGFGSTYKIEWFLGNDKVDLLSKAAGINNRYSPRNSMLDKVWVDNKSILHYNIKLRYSINNINNTLRVVITTIDNKQYIFLKEILFLKDGDLGTSGTTYVAAIRPCDGNGIKKGGFLPLWYDKINELWLKNKNNEDLCLKCYVYKNGEEISVSSTETENPFTWILKGVKNLGTALNEKIAIQGVGVLDQDRYVKVTVKVDGILIYALYPIDVVVNNDADNELDINKLDFDILSYIKYSSSGRDPLYYSSIIKVDYNGNNYDDEVASMNDKILKVVSSYKYVDSNKNDIDSEDVFLDGGNYYYKTIIDETETRVPVTREKTSPYRLSPESNFNFSDLLIGLLKCLIDNNYILHSIIMYLDTYGNEAINGWDGTELELASGKYYLNPTTGDKVFLTLSQESNVYSSDGKNWIKIDENIYEVKLGSAHILAPLIGAGEKDNANCFTGVVMGKDAALDKIGLYGYSNGICSFGFRDDGTAFIGKPNDARIEFNGGTSTIESSNYKTSNGKQGLLINLKNAIIKSKSFILDGMNLSFKFELDSNTNSSFFEIYGSTSSLPVFQIKQNCYILQSVDKDNFYVDLGNGHVRMNSVETTDIKVYDNIFIYDSSSNALVCTIDAHKSDNNALSFTTTGSNGIRFENKTGSGNFYVYTKSGYINLTTDDANTADDAYTNDTGILLKAAGSNIFIATHDSGGTITLLKYIQNHITFL